MSTSRRASLVLLLLLHAAAPEEVCFNSVGCFSMTSPWHSLSRPIPEPQPPDLVDTTLYLFTRSTAKPVIVNKLPEVTIEGFTFNPNRPTYFLTHGFLAHELSWLYEMKDALQMREDGNVFVVEWRKGASNLNYLEVAANTRVVSAEIARVVEYLINNEGANITMFNLIGHSLGAHIMSYVAKRIPGIGRIIALDPAQPGFEGFPAEVRLDRSDAAFVEVIHTNAKPFFPLLGAGMMGAVGHVDFYINGGWDQPGCFIPKNVPQVQGLSELALLPLEVLGSIVKCPHERSIHVFTQSLLNPGCIFWGRRVNPFTFTASVLSGGNFNWLWFRSVCSGDSCSPLGLETVNYPARGSFLLSTTWTEPFCIDEPDNNIVMAPYRQETNIIQI